MFSSVYLLIKCCLVITHNVYLAIILLLLSTVKLCQCVIFAWTEPPCLIDECCVVGHKLSFRHIQSKELSIRTLTDWTFGFVAFSLLVLMNPLKLWSWSCDCWHGNMYAYKLKCICDLVIKGVWITLSPRCPQDLILMSDISLINV